MLTQKRLKMALLVLVVPVAMTGFSTSIAIADDGLGSESNPGFSCFHILAAGASLGNGLYWIDPDGLGGSAAFETYCDMTTDGGGWTKVNDVDAATIDMIMQGSASQINARQMLKCSDEGTSAIISPVSPTITSSWSWSTKQKLGGTWNVNGANRSCGTASEFDAASYGWGFGCSNGGGSTNKLYPGMCDNPFPNNCGIPAAHTNSSFTICGSNNYGSYSIFVREIEPFTLIELSSFTATPSDRKVIIEWSTESEIDNAGFNLYRKDSRGGQYTQINDSLIPAEGFPDQGASYEFLDDNVLNRKTYWYKLEDIDIYGNSTVHGPVAATPRLIYRLFE